MAVGTGSNPNRQRMINLMYIVFIAMMALNVSPEVLDGFSKVEGELRQATAASEAQNGRLASDMQAAFSTNPAKASIYYEQSQELQRRTDSLYQHLQPLPSKLMGAVHPPIPYSIETIYQQPLSYYLPPFTPRGRSYASI